MKDKANRDITYQIIKCPKVGLTVFIPKDRQEDATLWAMPGMTAIYASGTKILKPRFVTLDWIRKYAEDSGKGMRWVEMTLWRSKAHLDSDLSSPFKRLGNQ